jgi:hypothetical protein
VTVQHHECGVFISSESTGQGHFDGRRVQERTSFGFWFGRVGVGDFGGGR